MPFQLMLYGSIFSSTAPPKLNPWLKFNFVAIFSKHLR